MSPNPKVTLPILNLSLGQDIRSPKRLITHVLIFPLEKPNAPQSFPSRFPPEAEWRQHPTLLPAVPNLSAQPPALLPKHSSTWSAAWPQVQEVIKVINIFTWAVLSSRPPSTNVQIFKHTNNTPGW